MSDFRPYVRIFCPKCATAERRAAPRRPHPTMTACAPGTPDERPADKKHVAMERYAAFGTRVRQLFGVRRSPLRSPTPPIPKPPARAAATAAGDVRALAARLGRAEGMLGTEGYLMRDAERALAHASETRAAVSTAARTGARGSKAGKGAAAAAARASRPARAGALRSSDALSAQAHTVLSHTSEVADAVYPSVPAWFAAAGTAVAAIYMAADIAGRARLEASRPPAERNVGRAVLAGCVFHGIASVAAPTVLVHGAMRAAHVAIGRRRGSWARYAPTAAGLAVIPLMPVLVDAPVEAGVQAAFALLWPVPPAEATASTVYDVSRGRAPPE